MILDGLAYFGVTLEQWRTGDLPKGHRNQGLPHVARLKGMGPPPALTEISDAAPLPARVMHGWWIVDCPCNGGDFVWLATPLQWCGSCGNAMLGGLWRRVTLPEHRQEIESALLARSEPSTRNWFPHETVADLLAENAEHLAGVSLG